MHLDASRRIAVWIRIAGAAAQPIASLRPLATGSVALHKSIVGASVQPAFRAGSTAVRIRIAGAAAQPIAGCTPECRTTARYWRVYVSPIAPNHSAIN